MSAARRIGVGIIGAGNISSQYLKAMAGFDVLEIVGIADMKPRSPRSALPSSACRPPRSMRSRRPQGRDHPQPHYPARPCRSRPPGHRGGQACLMVRSRSASLSPRAKKLIDAAKAAGLRVGSAPRHIPGRFAPAGAR
jgi:hypothetical protein